MNEPNQRPHGNRRRGNPRGGTYTNTVRANASSDARDGQPSGRDPHDPSGLGSAGSSAGSGRKRESLTHLLNFSLPPRELPVRFVPRRKATVPAYDKEKFVNANFRFVIDPIADYSAYASDPDITIPWMLIQSIIVTIDEPLSCPICLGSPLAARITKCGHVYCLSCVLHYLSEEKKSWRKCPICWESVYVKDLRPIIVKMGVAHVQERSTLRMVLMRRSQMSSVVVSESACRLGSVPLGLPSHTLPGAVEFSRLVLGGIEFVREKLDRDLIDLMAALTDGTADELERHFILAAISLIKLHMEGLNEAKDAGSFTDSPDESTSYIFYQAADGQHIYLSPLDIRVLKAEFGEYAAFPLELDVSVLHVQESTMTEDVRRRLKYLAHVPLQSDITLLEIDLGKIVSPAMMKQFSDSLSRRRKEHANKKRRDAVAEARRERTQLESALPEQTMMLDAMDFPAAESMIQGTKLLGPVAVSAVVDAAQPSFAGAVGGTSRALSGGTASWVRMSAAEEAAVREGFGQERVIDRKGKKTLVLLSNGGGRRRM